MQATRAVLTSKVIVSDLSKLLVFKSAFRFKKAFFEVQAAHIWQLPRHPSAFGSFLATLPHLAASSPPLPPTTLDSAFGARISRVSLQLLSTDFHVLLRPTRTGYGRSRRHAFSLWTCARG